MDVPELIIDAAVRLREHTETDLDRIIEQINDPRSQRWITLPVPYGPAEAEDYLRTVRSHHTDGSKRHWAIEVDGRFAGSIEYAMPTGGVTEVGYGLHPDARGRGVGTAALRAVLDHAFGVDGVEVMTWRAGYGNLASRRVAWSCGFTVDGIWRDKHVNAHGHRDDLWVGSLRAADPREPTHPWWEPTELPGERVRLRGWRADDVVPTPDGAGLRFATGMWPAEVDYEGWRLDRLSRMADGEGVFWCVADAGTDEAIGHVQLISMNLPATAGTGVLGYWLAPSARGRGLAGEVVDLALGHAVAARRDLAGRSGLGLHRIVARCRPENTASARSLRRWGFRPLAEERSALTPQADGGTHGDQLTFELLASDDRAEQRVEPIAMPVIETGRVRLRAWTEGDRPRDDQRPDAETLRHVPAGVIPTPETFDAWLARRRRRTDQLIWCLADRATDEPLGSVLIFGIDRGVHQAELGYWLHPEARGQGLLVDAVPVVIAHAFAPTADGGLGLQRLHAVTDTENDASQRVLLRHGFMRSGTDRRAWLRVDGTLADVARFELLAEPD